MTKKKLNKALKLTKRLATASKEADECIQAARKLMKAARHIMCNRTEEALESMSEAYVMTGTATIAVLAEAAYESQCPSGKLSTDSN